jgi:hypothetical protein
MAVPEFIYLNEQAVRVTGWQHDEATGSVELIVVARGDAERDTVLDTLSGEPVMVRVGAASAVPMEVRALDTKTSGSAARTVHRIKASLWPEGAPNPADASRDRKKHDPIESRLDEIIRLLTDIRDEIRKQS